MADRPLSNPLPADLPEDWASGQTVAPYGADVGLSEQHGYNYLMEQVNAAQRAANAINESFDTISGKRTCRVTIGTSTAGWTQADCDYLCDGTDDQEKLNAAIAAVYAQGGGEIAVLGGEYFLTEQVGIQAENTSLTISGEPGSTIFKLSSGIILTSGALQLTGLVFRATDPSDHASVSAQLSNYLVIRNCVFEDVGVGTYGAPFIFQQNRVEISEGFPMDASSLAPINVSLTGTNTLLFADNIVKASIGHTSGSGQYVFVASVLSGEGNSALVVSNNTLAASGAERPYFYIYGGSVVGNGFSGVNFDVGGGASVSGNYIAKSDVFLSDATVSYNTLEESSIYASGRTLISGNQIGTADGNNTITARKISPDATKDSAPSIVGNSITGGNIGIYLQKNASQYDPDVTNALISNNRVWGCTTPIQIDDNWSRCMVTGNMFPEEGAIVDNGTDNIIRLNSDDPGGSSGGSGSVAGVSSFKGRTGAVVPQTGDYTATMVGARPDTWTPTAADIGAVSSTAVQSIQTLTQAEYDALSVKNSSTLYLIKE